jgi:hypothetical protein
LFGTHHHNRLVCVNNRSKVPAGKQEPLLITA